MTAGRPVSSQPWLALPAGLELTTFRSEGGPARTDAAIVWYRRWVVQSARRDSLQGPRLPTHELVDHDLEAAVELLVGPAMFSYSCHQG